ncbi:hypothetical protein AB1Y20_000276 [Prymnesium parvum]|uniref:Uncharacterized protein n=1 Tax=Prymnesium parvum TaxID=97485 RepID=A0AB34K812_PRYPA
MGGGGDRDQKLRRSVRSYRYPRLYRYACEYSRSFITIRAGGGDGEIFCFKSSMAPFMLQRASVPAPPLGSRPLVSAVRNTVEKALRDASNNGSLSSYIVYVGTASAKQRGNPTAAYECALTSSKVIVTCNPWRWEGDARTPEALASGALVLVDSMEMPPPGVHHSKSVLFYRSTSDLLRLLQWALHNAREADTIAHNGALASLTTVEMVDTMIQVVMRHTTTLRAPIRLFVVPVHERFQSNEYLLTVDGLKRSKLVDVQKNVSTSDVILLDLWRLHQGCGKYFVRPARRCFESYLLGEVLPKYAGSRIVVATDWSDPPWLAMSADLMGNESIIHFLFKRSQVKRSGDGRWARRMNYSRPVWPLWYPILPSTKARMFAQTRMRPRSSRPVDVSYFFGPYTSFDTVSAKENTDCQNATYDYPGRPTSPNYHLV